VGEKENAARWQNTKGKKDSEEIDIRKE